ncbi:c-type cytochrome [Marinobacter vinifirmus]|nr:c-type cytochrome [Marinobacter vinifirmus]
MLRKLCTGGLLVAGMMAAPVAFSQSVHQALSELESIMADDSRRDAAYAAGKERILFCGSCHGKDGNSRRDYIPNLADQHPLYLFEQFEKFGNGVREDYVMSKLAQTLTVEERINIAVYYSLQQAKPRTSPAPDLIDAGRAKFQAKCSACHGKEAEDFRDMPRLAGQPSEYIKIALKRFKEMDPAAQSSPMIGIAAPLTAGDVEELAAFLTTL